MQIISRQPTSYAIHYAKMGWKLIPMHSVRNGRCSCKDEDCGSPGKHPRIKGWQEQASDRINTIFDWWRQFPDSNIGIATGKISGIVVLDIDTKHKGEESALDLQEEFEAFPDTLIGQSGSGGQHIYFRAPAASLGNRVALRPGVDFRAEGGLIVAPPSSHLSGGVYQWLKDPRSTPLADLPDWLFEEVKREKPKAMAVVNGLVEIGSRDDFLTSRAGSLRRAKLNPVDMETALHVINESQCNPPLPPAQVKKIATSIAGYPNGAEEPLTWPETPQPLPSKRQQVPNLSEKLIPEILRPWVMDVAERMQVAPELVAVPALVSMAAVVGRKIGIFPRQKDNWMVVPNLWGAVVARPGSLKSPTIAEALRPLDTLIKVAQEKYEAEKTAMQSREQALFMEMEAKKEDLKKSFKGKKGGGESEELEIEIARIQLDLSEAKVIERRYKTNDATVEKLGHLLRDNPNGFLLFRDELAGWMRTLDKAGREGDREFYLESWNGYGSYSVDRVGTGTIHIPAICMSILGGIQPSKLDELMQLTKGGNKDDGLLQRFQMLVYPDDKGEWNDIDRSPDEKALGRVVDFFSWLDKLDGSLLSDERCGKESIPGVRFSEPAQAAFREWRKNLENRLRSGEIDHPGFEAHLAKYRSLIPTLALLFWLPEVASGKHVDAVSLAATECAIKWAAFLEEHAKRIYFANEETEGSSAHTLMAKITSGFVTDDFPVRRLYRNNWKNLGSKDQIESALMMLEQLGWLKSILVRGRGNKSLIIKLHPSLVKKS